MAALVDGQQEQIDAVEENVHAAKSSVDKGLRHIEYARDRLCVMGDEGFEVPQCGGMEDFEEKAPGSKPKGNESHEPSTSSSPGKESEKFSWSKPFQTLQRDILGLGNDLASLGCSISENIECGLGASPVYNDAGSLVDFSGKN